VLLEIETIKESARQNGRGSGTIFTFINLLSLCKFVVQLFHKKLPPENVSF